MPVIQTPDSPGLTATSEEDDSKDSSNPQSTGAASSLVTACVSSQASSSPGSVYCLHSRENVLQRLSEALLRRSLVKVRLHRLCKLFHRVSYESFMRCY